MKKKDKTLIVSLLGAIGLIILLIGIFTPWYDVVTGVLIALIIWILTGVLSKYWGVKKK